MGLRGQASAGTKLSDKFTGIVCEVVSGDCLVVRDAANGQERRVNLSSIRAPRFGRKGEKPEDWAIEAKEFLRQRLIGQQLHHRLMAQQLVRSHMASPQIQTWTWVLH